MLQDYINSRNGKPIEVEDPFNRDQCMDLAFDYLDWKNIPRASIRHLYAYQVFTEASDLTRQYFDVIPAANAFPYNAGDLVILGQSVGPAGHIEMATGKTIGQGYEAFGQNWDIANHNAGRDENGKLIPIAAVYTHPNHSQVIGILRPKNNQAPKPKEEVEMPTQSEIRDLFLQLTGSEPTDQDYKDWGPPATWSQVFYGVKDSVRGVAWTKKCLTNVNSNPTKLNKGIYEV